jgi:WD40 repeat protein
MTTKLRQAMAVLLLTAGYLAAPAAFGQSPRQNGLGNALPPQAVARLGTLRFRHGAGVTAIAHTPDGHALLTDSKDGTVRLWDLKTGAEIRRFRKDGRVTDSASDPEFNLVFGGPVNGIAVAHDGRTLAVGASDGSITLWDTATANVIRKLKSDSPAAPAALLFTADNEMLVVKDSDQIVWVWDLARGTVLRKLGVTSAENRRFLAGVRTGPPTLLSGSVIASVTLESRNRELRTVVKRWDLVTGTEQGSVELSSGTNLFSAFAFAPDGKTFAAGGYLSALSLWDLDTQKELRSLDGLDMTAFVSRLTFSPDSKRLAGWTSDQTIRIWDTATGKELRRIGEARGSRINGIYFFGGTYASNLAFSPDGSVLTVGTAGGTVRRWEVETGKELAEANGHRDLVHTLKITADGKNVVSAGVDRTVHVWDVGTGAELRHFALPGDVTQTAFAPDGQSVAVGNPEGTLALWDVKSGKEMRKWPATRNGFAGLAFSADGKVLATRSFDQVLDLWDAATGKQLRSIGETAPGSINPGGNNILLSHLSSPVPNVFFSTDGTTLATVPPAETLAIRRFAGRRPASSGFAVRLWDVTTGKQLRPFDPRDGGTTAFASAPDGRTLATAVSDGSLYLWETASGKVRLRAAAGPAGTISALAFTPDSRLLAGGDESANIRFWDTLTGAEVGRLTGHQGKIHTLAFTADGTRLVSGSADTSLLVWDVTGIGKGQSPRSVAVEDGRHEALWHALAIHDPARAHLAALRLIAAPDEAVPLLRERLRPVAAPAPAKVAELLANLDNKQLAVRQQAAGELEQLGELIEPALRQALADQPSLERQKRLEQLQERLVSGTALAVEQLQGLRAVEVLERVGTAEAQDVLRLLAGGASGSRLTRQAQAALDRLSKP